MKCCNNQAILLLLTCLPEIVTGEALDPQMINSSIKIYSEIQITCLLKIYFKNIIIYPNDLDKNKISFIGFKFYFTEYADSLFYYLQKK